MSLRRKHRFSRLVMPFILAAMLIPGLASAFSPFVVQDVRVDGLQRVDAGTVFSYLPVKVGETFTQEDATQAIQKLYGSGFFSDVKIDSENGVLVVTVKERPTIAAVTFNGMREFDAKELTKALGKVGFGSGRIFDRSLLDRAVFELKQQYLSKGKYAVQITPIVTPLPRNRVGISFDIFEGDVARIKQINFVGNKAFSQSDLLDQLSLTTSGFMTWYTNTDKYSSEKLEGDVDRIRSFYLDRGYLEYSAEPPQVSISPDRRDIYITFTIHEGKPYKVRSVKLAGNLLGLGDQIRQLIQVKAGETFSAAKSNATAKAITQYLGSLGYAFANVNPNPALDRKDHEADITFYVDPGRRVYVRRIQIGGNVRTRDEVIRREMRQQEASWYDSTNIKASRDRIDRLGYFKDINIHTTPVAGSPDEVDLNVDVKEKPTGLLNLGIGYGTTDKVMLSAGISQDNIFGSGKSLSLRVNTSSYNRAAVLSTTDPYWTINGISKTTSLYYRRTTPYDTDDSDGDYKVTAIGGGLNFGIPISETDRIFMGTRFENNNINLDDDSPQAYKDFVADYGNNTNSLIFNVGWSKDTRDSAIAPTKGNYTHVSADVSNMDLQYYMLSAQEQYYMPLGRSFTLAFNAQADWGRSYGGKPFPVIKNVYAGGIGSVRGYEGGSLGPRDVTSGNYLGGAQRIVGNVQLYLPFPGATRDRTLRWFVFADAGQVKPGNGMQCTGGQDNKVEDPCGWRYSAGIGVSWQSPLGPFQLSYGRALNQKSGDDTQAFQFQIGTGF